VLLLLFSPSLFWPSSFLGSLSVDGELGALPRPLHMAASEGSVLSFAALSSVKVSNVKDSNVDSSVVKDGDVLCKRYVLQMRS
jgi:hypothetical protein